MYAILLEVSHLDKDKDKNEYTKKIDTFTHYLTVYAKEMYIKKTFYAISTYIKTWYKTQYRFIQRATKMLKQKKEVTFWCYQGKSLVTPSVF